MKPLLLLIARPFIYLATKFIKPVLLKIYKLYLIVINRIRKSIRFKNRLSFLVANRHFIHVILIIIGLLVTSSNVLNAQEIRSDDFGKKSALYGLIKNDEEEIIETAESIKPKQQKRYISNSIAVTKSTPELEADDEAEEDIIALAGSAIVKENVLETESGQRGNIIEHEVEEGESVGTLADRYGVSASTILWANDLDDDDYIKPGQTLSIPPTTGVVYVVKSNDTLDSIADKYEGDATQIAEYNDLENTSSIIEGQTLIIPDGKVPPPPAPAPTTRLADLGTLWSGTPTTSDPAPPAAAPTGGSLQWPTTSHRISQYYHWGHRAIDVDGVTGDPLYAAEAGTVVSAGWNGGYGLRVVINHGGGMQTLYGHASKIYVTPGQTVTRGQTIALQGNTGWSTGDHLHFEVIVNGSKPNPLSYF